MTYQDWDWERERGGAPLRARSEIGQGMTGES